MPELPEVTTTVNGLNKVLPGTTIVDVWTDLAKKNQQLKQFQNTIKSEVFFKKFKKAIVGKKIVSVTRRAKNILIKLSGEYTILIHLKMTGHLLFGKYNKKISKDKFKITTWIPAEDGPLNDPYNRFIHVVFFLSNNKHLAFCDSRKFGKVTMVPTKELEDNISSLSLLGPEPLEEAFSFLKFKEAIITKPNKNIKTVLMDQTVIAGIGNIYSDEMLWLSGLHPESRPIKISEKKLKILYREMREILNKGIYFGGDSMSDYRNIDGNPGKFQNHHNVYRRNKEKCRKSGCSGVIMRKVINGRSAHFCNKHQTLFN